MLNNSHALRMFRRICFFACVVANAQTVTPDWAQSVNGCVRAQAPDSSSAEKFMNGQHVRFTPGHGGKIHVTCSVFNTRADGTPPDWNTLEVGYSDRDGQVSGQRVDVRLMRLNSQGVPLVIATFDSDDYIRSHRITRAVRFSHPFEFREYVYYLQITLDRVPGGWDAELTPEIYSVRLKRADQ